MKKLFDGIGTLITLFLVGAIIFGALKEGYVIQVILVIGVIGFFIWQSDLKDKREEKKGRRSLRKKDERNLIRNLL